MLTTRRVLLAAAGALVPATALATEINVDTWTGKIRGQKSSTVAIYRDRVAPMAQVSITLSCKSNDGPPQVYGLSAQARIKHGKLSVVNRKAYDGTGGYLKVKARVPVGAKAKGRVTFKVPASASKTCHGSGRFTGKYAIKHGG